MVDLKGEWVFRSAMVLSSDCEWRRNKERSAYSGKVFNLRTIGFEERMPDFVLVLWDDLGNIERLLDVCYIRRHYLLLVGLVHQISKITPWIHKCIQQSTYSSVPEEVAISKVAAVFRQVLLINR